MIARPFVRLSFANVAAERQPTRTEIIEHEFRHELAVITVPSASVDMKRYQTGVPVKLTWGVGPTKQRTFVGYVSHTEPDIGANTKKVVCIGASFVMKEGGYDGFRDITAPAMVRRVATKFRFDATHVKDHARVFPSVSQSGRSYWQFMSDLAERIGYTLYCRGTTLYFHDRLAALSAQKLIPLFGGTSPAIHSFSAQLGQSTPTGGQLANRAGYGVNPFTGKPVLAQVDTTKTKPVLGTTPIKALFLAGEATTPVHTLADGQQDLKGAAAHNVLSVTAHAELEGNPRVQVGDAVMLTGLGKVNSGRWYVISATHVIEGVNRYRTKVHLGRDAVAAVSQPAPQTGLPTPLRGSRAVNGIWVAA